MNQMTAPFPLPSFDAAASDAKERIAQWLRLYIADVLSVTPDSIDAEASFNQIGLDSSAAVGMTGDLGDWLGRELDAAVAYDHPSIAALAAALAAER